MKFLCLLLLFVLSESKLDVFTEEELRRLFNDEKHVFVLLSEESQCTGTCATLEDTLVSLREDLVEDTGGWVARSHAPAIQDQMGVKGSAILYMREGRPLIYSDSNVAEEKLLSYFLANKASAVHNLTDDNFEHLTQAGTGATTGDWMVMFSRRDCKDCDRMLPVVESVGVALKGRKNVAIVERESGAVTARRFSVKTFPAFILFRLGKLYRYTFDLKDQHTLAAFASDTFRNTKGEDIPQPKSPFDDFTESCADWLKENPITFLGSASGVLLVVAFIYLLNRPPPKSWKVKKNKKHK